jgi:SAM-dependent methyltransferase
VNAPVEWWRTFFSGPVVDSWLKATAPEQDGEEAEFIRSALGVAPPAKLLDVPCGGGRHCRALAALGYEMTGVDGSTDFLAAARSISAGLPGKLTWEQRDMRDLPWPSTFDGAYLFGNSFGYLDDDGNAAFLKAVARALKPGARFVMDVSYVMEVVLPSLQERAWYQTGDIIMLASRQYDPVRSRLEVEYTWIRDGAVDRRSMSARVYSFREMLRLLEEAGFVNIEAYGSLARAPFRLGSPRLLAVAAKPGA